MKLTSFLKSVIVASLAVSGVVASPIVKRSSISESPVGYASTNGGTTGGTGGTTVSVSTLANLKKYAKADGAYIIYVTADISGAEALKVTSDKTIVGKTSGVTLTGVGLYIKDAENVIVRNLVIKKCIAPTDAVSIQASKNVWIDHVDASSDTTHDKDYYDGLMDVTHASDYVTISNCYLHDHWKTSLVGHSDSNGDEDTGHLTVTYVGNYWKNVNSRCPSFRFGTGHIVNNYFEDINDGINIRDGAKILIENNVFTGSSKGIYSVDGTGLAKLTGNHLNGATSDITGTTVSLPYSYSAEDGSTVAASVKAEAGANLSF